MSEATSLEKPPVFIVDLVDRQGRPDRVRGLFDRYANDFDIHMAHLGYTGPSILSGLVDRVMPGRRGLRVLDLGCGTGLAGVAFRGRASWLEGADLSPRMIEKARERQIYDALEVADLETTLAAPAPAYDLILAADVLVYLGDLAATINAAAGRLLPGGVFCFTLEAKEGDGYEMGPWRRWLHSEPYVRALAKAAGLTVAKLDHTSSRNNFGLPVPGIAVALQAPLFPPRRTHRVPAN